MVIEWPKPHSGLILTLSHSYLNVLTDYFSALSAPLMRVLIWLGVPHNLAKWHLMVPRSVPVRSRFRTMEGLSSSAYNCVKSSLAHSKNKMGKIFTFHLVVRLHTALSLRRAFPYLAAR
jgi:hypothetical protein